MLALLCTGFNPATALRAPHMSTNLGPAHIMPKIRAPHPSMGGLTGLPRIPPAALRLTKPFNPSGSYTEPIATLWRDLETLFGMEDIAGLGGSRTYRDSSRLVDSGKSTNKFRGFTYSVDQRQATVLSACKRVPSLLNPAVSNRFAFAKAKAVLVSKLGSQQAAIEVMKKDPTILQRPADELQLQSADQIQSKAVVAQMMGSPAPAVLLLVLVATVAHENGLVALPAGL